MASSSPGCKYLRKGPILLRQALDKGEENIMRRRSIATSNSAPAADADKYKAPAADFWILTNAKQQQQPFDRPILK